MSWDNQFSIVLREEGRNISELSDVKMISSQNFSCQPVIHEEEIMDVCRVNHLDSFSSW